MNEIIAKDRKSFDPLKNVPREKVEELQRAASRLPQVDTMQTEHYFAGGMYCRRVFLAAGTMAVSKVHKSEHLFVGCIGNLQVWGEGEFYVISPGDIRKSEIGTKRIVYAPHDVVVLTIHKTDKIDLNELEKELIEDDETALLDVNNKPKPGVLVMDKIKVLEK